MSLVNEFWPYLVLILVGFLPNEVWRVLGLVFARGLDEDSQVILWVRGVATAILAGVVAKLIVSPSGALLTVPLSVRVAAAAAGLIAFLLIRRSVFAGVLVGEAVLIGGGLVAGP
ncbi:MAG: branched-chain amino acid transport [Xanthobacteraceae bacterium]|jgi:hypothetical protein|nr:branched-chain amino acid transport [Xanthobacteraceae bacterium]